jgi:hypothetical protein
VWDVIIETQTGPAVIPLQALGVIDVGASYVGDNEVLAHALANTSSSLLEGGYAIKRSGTFVNEYGRAGDEGNAMDGGADDPHHMMAAFPTLWCYGKGGMETKHPIPVSYDLHVRAALEHHDRRFSLHLQFIFQAFGVLQK